MGCFHFGGLVIIIIFFFLWIPWQLLEQIKNKELQYSCLNKLPLELHVHVIGFVDLCYLIPEKEEI